MRLKQGVRLHGVRPEIVVAMMVTDSIYKNFGQELVITAVSDGKHVPRSDHYSGEAFDCRTRYFDEEQQDDLERAMKAGLGQDFIVILESDHMHVSWRPLKL